MQATYYSNKSLVTDVHIPVKLQLTKEIVF